jgi:hypothetical protein
MAITITLLPSNTDGSGSNLLYAIGTLTFSGNYPTGGDTLDFTTVADKLSSTQIIQVSPTVRTEAQATTCRCRELRSTTGSSKPSPAAVANSEPARIRQLS